jgi:hypothetical protein
MRETWSLFVVTYAGDNFISHQVLDFGSPNWADTAYRNLQEAMMPVGVQLKVIKLY